MQIWVLNQIVHKIFYLIIISTTLSPFFSGRSTGGHTGKKKNYSYTYTNNIHLPILHFNNFHFYL